MFVIGSHALEQVEVISVTGVTTLSERRLKKTLSTYFNKDTCTRVGTFTLLSPDIVSFCSSSLTVLHLLQQLLMDKRVGLKRYELNGRKVLFYFDEVSDRGGGVPHLTCICSE